MSAWEEQSVNNMVTESSIISSAICSFLQPAHDLVCCTVGINKGHLWEKIIKQNTSSGRNRLKQYASCQSTSNAFLPLHLEAFKHYCQDGVWLSSFGRRESFAYLSTSLVMIKECNMFQTEPMQWLFAGLNRVSSFLISDTKSTDCQCESEDRTSFP